MKTHARISLLAAIVLGASAGPALAVVTPVKVVQRWTGRVPLGVQPPLQSSVVSADALQVVWTLCQVKGEMPAVDFGRQMVVVAVRSGSTVRFQNMQLVDGNLRTNVVVTPDSPAHSTCALALIDRAGVTRVNGMPLGQ
jgi:hypothetical protein